MNDIGSYILSLFLLITTLWTVKKYLSNLLPEKDKSIFSFLSWGVFTVFQAYIEFCNNRGGIWLPVINIILLYFISRAFYRKVGLKNFFAVISFCTVGSIVEGIVNSVLSIFTIEENYTAGEILSKVIMVMFVYLSSVLYKRKEESISFKFLFLLILIPLGSLYIIMNDFFIMESKKGMIFPVISFCILLLFMMIIFEIYQKLSDDYILENENSLYVQQLEWMKTKIEEKKEVSEEFYNYKHNMINEMLVIRNCIENGEYDYILDRFDKIAKISEAKSNIVDSGNDLVDSIINFKYGKIKEKNIDFNAKICIPDKLPLEQSDLGIVLGNAIDNAIEAAEECSTISPKIEVIMGIKKGALIIRIKNTFQHTLKRNKEGRLISTKKETVGHGYGIRSIEKTVENYQGDVIFEIQNNLFIITIIMNLPDF